MSSMRRSFLGRTASKTMSSLKAKNHSTTEEEEDAVAAESAKLLEAKEESWGALGTDLLLEILGRVEASSERWPNRRSVVACAGVCRRWREVTRDMVMGETSLPTGNITFPSCLKQPGPRDPPQQCLVKRDKKNSTFFLYQSLIAPFTAKGKFLLAAKRCRSGGHTEYIISIDANDISQGSNTYVGKLRSDLLCTSFTIYDSQPPRKCERQSDNKSSRRVASKQISPQVPAGNFKVGQISYKFNLLKSRGPRRMVCAVELPWPDKHNNQQFKEISKENISESCSNSYSVLSNKTPRWHQQMQCWCLNFHGRVTVASVKNFQLAASVDQSQPGGKGDEDIVLLQFGKVSCDTFTMDYRQPLSAFQAFAICLTSFGTKLACE